MLAHAQLRLFRHVDTTPAHVDDPLGNNKQKRFLKRTTCARREDVILCTILGREVLVRALPISRV